MGTHQRESCIWNLTIGWWGGICWTFENVLYVFITLKSTQRWSVNNYEDSTYLCPRGVMVKAMDRGIVVNEFEHQSRYYVHFRKIPFGKLRTLYPSTYGLNSTTAVFLKGCCPVGWGCRMHWLLICRGVRPHPANECFGYDTKQSDGEVPAVLELWRMQGNPSLPSLPGPLWPRVVAPDRVLSMG